jgi:hypothetical protein
LYDCGVDPPAGGGATSKPPEALPAERPWLQTLSQQYAQFVQSFVINAIPHPRAALFAQQQSGFAKNFEVVTHGWL